MTLLDDYRRVSKDRPCPICGRPDWCLFKRGDPPTAAICARMPSSTAWGEAGWFHRLATDIPLFCRAPRVRRIGIKPMSRDERMVTLADIYKRAVHPGDLDRLAQSLGLTAESLRRLGIGWTGHHWSFPMLDTSDSVSGIRLRTPEGKKFSERGGHEGLFVPSGLTGTEPLLIAEGPTDTAALLDFGFDAIGRPSARSGVRLISDFARRGVWQRHVIFSDPDGPGLDGARKLARVLAVLSPDVRVIVPPAKDARAWKNAGATRANVLALIDAAPPIRISVRRAHP